MSDTLTCDIQTVSRDVVHPHEKEFKFLPKFKWEGVVIEVTDNHVLGKIYDEVNDISSEVEIDNEVIAPHQRYFKKEGTLFNLYSGEEIKSQKQSLLFELRKEPFHITSFDDLIEMHSKLDISRNIKSK